MILFHEGLHEPEFIAGRQPGPPALNLGGEMLGLMNFGSSPANLRRPVLVVEPFATRRRHTGCQKAADQAVHKEVVSRRGQQGQE